MANNPSDPDIFNSEDQDPAGDNEGGYTPPLEPLGVQSFGTTAAEERAGEGFGRRSEHTQREDVDNPGYDPTLAGQLVQPGDTDVDDIDDETNTIALDAGFGVEGDVSAEEAAMHIVDDQS